MAEKLLEKALTANRESKFIEFKQEFDPGSTGEWCELIKDVVALANSGGGVLLFGVDSAGRPTRSDLSKLFDLDPADISNRLGRYIGKEEIVISIETPSKQKNKLVAWQIGGIAVPVIFEKPGTYPIESGRQRTAFGEGTVYFRHGAKSEPANNVDIARSVSRYVERIKKGWLTGLKQIVEAPVGSTVAITANTPSSASALHGQSVKVTDAPDAIAVTLTRDTTKATGTFLHEEVSDSLFSGINNVVDANRLLFKEQGKFLLGWQAYYRVYSEREQVIQPAEEIEKLLYSGIGDYMPSLYWYSRLPPTLVASYLADILLWPKGNEVQTLLRIAPLMGEEFCKWMYVKFEAKWGTHSQPPSFFHNHRQMIEDQAFKNPITAASRLTAQSLIQLPNEPPIATRELLSDTNRSSETLSRACLKVFEGNKELRAIARSLDYITYGNDIIQNRQSIGHYIIAQVGDRLPDQQQ